MRGIGSRRIRRKRKARQVFAFFILLILIISFFGLEGKLRPMIKSAALIQAQSITANNLNKAAEEVLSENEDTYSSLIQIERDADGRVTSVSANTPKINLLKANLTRAMQTSVNATVKEDIRIPLGSITGNSFFLGRGPSIPIRLRPMNSVITDLQSSLSDSGINQTRHQIQLIVSANFQSIAAGYTTPFTVTTKFLIAESVIVGIVPEAFTEVIKSDESLIGDLVDFSAQPID